MCYHFAVAIVDTRTIINKKIRDIEFVKRYKMQLTMTNHLEVIDYEHSNSKD